MNAKQAQRAPQVSITLTYGVFATLWIFFSDTILYALFTNAIEQLPTFSVLKGLFFVLVTSALLYTLLYRELSYRNQVEHDLRESELRFRQLTENIHDVFYLSDSTSGDMLYVSPAYETLWGRSCQSLYEKPLSFLDAVHPDDHARVVASFAQQQHSKYVEVSYRIIQPNQGVRWVRARTFPIIEKDGTFRRVAGIIKDITVATRYENQLKRLAQRLVNVLDVERSRIARELHDQIGQQLTALGINIGILQASLGDKHAHAQRLEDSADILSTVIERVRFIISDLRPPVLDDLGLVAGMRWYCDKFSQRTRIKVVFENQLSNYNPSSDLSHTLYQIAQEAMTNIAKHAEATQVTVRLQIKNDLLTLSIKDNGKGFDPSTALQGESGAHWGLKILHERVRALVGATLHIASKEGEGTEVCAEVPL